MTRWLKLAGNRRQSGVIRNLAARRLGLLTAAVAMLAPLGQVLAAPPTSGPGVLFSPFYYKNYGEPHYRHLDSSNGINTWGGLLGPLTWTNPPRGGVEYQFSENERPSEEWLVEGGLVAGEDSTLVRVQGQQPVSPTLAEPSSVIPIPSETIPAPTAVAPGAAPGALAEAESLGEEPEAPRLQFLRTATVLLEPGELQIDYGAIYSLIENDFPSVVSTMSGDVVLESTLKQRQLFVPLEFRLGVTPRLQLFANIPIGWSNTEFAIAGALDADESDGGLGDITLGSTFLLFDGKGQTTDVVFTGALTLPTSDSPFVLGRTGFGQPSLGDNFYGLSGDLLWINNYDPLVIFYGVGLRHQFEKQVAGMEVDPGNEARVQLGVGFAVNSTVTLSTRFAASFITRTQFDGVSLEGSYAEPMSIRCAATVLRDCDIVEPFVEFGTTDDAASTSFGVVYTY